MLIQFKKMKKRKSSFSSPTNLKIANKAEENEKNIKLLNLTVCHSIERLNNTKQKEDLLRRELPDCLFVKNSGKEEC